MTTQQWLTIGGLALVLAGAAILSWRDLRRGGSATVGDLDQGLPRREARLGFPLIALGSALQIVAVSTGP